MMLYTAAINGVFAFLDRRAGFCSRPNGVTPEFLLNLLFYIIITPVISLTLTRIMYMSENMNRCGGCAGTHRFGAGCGAHAVQNVIRSIRRIPLCPCRMCISATTEKPRSSRAFRWTFSRDRRWLL